jgi:hypothetical protein
MEINPAGHLSDDGNDNIDPPAPSFLLCSSMLVYAQDKITGRSEITPKKRHGHDMHDDTAEY